ncbi:pirin family protein [Phenylobacterium sp.]|uniref:pirin family protein n=1 Tax=Phenylobacterium sp. TaxID=1871053 RepID=UPI002E366A0B|nr:pirin family protein [Phenylobacterium sp.]HEX2559905.1 pirin family protein [Phenylobacterium sp.]
MTDKTVLGVHAAHRDDIGDLVTRRPLPGPGLDQVDPFLFLNHHGPQVYPPGNRGLPFGPHPHRGFETVTFILEGELAHRDTGGHESVIRAGGVQWMTAGRGLVHAEVSPEDFKRRGGPLEILQLWVNLPSRLKMTEPRYTGVQQDEIPSLCDGGVELNLISGSHGGRTGPIESLTGVFMSTLRMEAGASVGFEGLSGRHVFLYLVSGEIRIGGRSIAQHHLVQLDRAGAILRIEAAQAAVLVFGHADPIDEPVVAHGPFVMTSVEEIRQAYADYQAGKFGMMAA